MYSALVGWLRKTTQSCTRFQFVLWRALRALGLGPQYFLNVSSIFVTVYGCLFPQGL